MMFITHNDFVFGLQGPYKSDTLLTVSWWLCCQGVHICSDANIFIDNIIYGLNFFQFSLFYYSKQKEKVINTFVE